MRLRKVTWRNGDVVTERHFQALEQWVETNLALLSLQMPGYGLLRLPTMNGASETPARVTLRHVQGAQYQAFVGQLCALTPRGRLLAVHDERSFELTLRGADRDSDGWVNLFLLPEDVGERLDGPHDVAQGPTLYEPPCVLATIDPAHEGLCIARFTAEGPSISMDQNFLPQCLTLDAFPKVLDRFERIVEQHARLAASLDTYLRALPRRPEMQVVAEFVSGVLRALGVARTELSSHAQFSSRYFGAGQSLFDALLCEVRILTARSQDTRLLHEAGALAGRLSERLSAVALDSNMARPFDLFEQGLEALARLLSCLPEGPAIEATLALKEVAFTKGTAYNKLLVVFADEVAYAGEKARLTFSFRDYSPREPSTWDVRLALGRDIPYGSLPQLSNFLRRTAADEFDFRLECPGSILGSGKMRQLTLYIPPPLGENVDSHRSRVTVSLIQ